jgi:hypothetical protein
MRNRSAFDRRLVGLVLLWTFLVSVLRTLRLPNDFAEVHWLFDYRFGFIKRGLAGAVHLLGCRAAGCPPTPGTIVAASALVYAAECVALLFVLWRLLRRNAFGAPAVLSALVFASSPFVVMSAHLFGYLDGLVYALAIASVALILRGRPMLAAPLQIAALLVHENYLLVGFPLAVAASILACSGAADRRTWRGHAAGLAVAMLAAAAVVVYSSSATDPAVLRDQLTRHLAGYDFVATRGRLVALCHTTSFGDFFSRQIGLAAKRCLDPSIALPVLPALLVLLSGAWLSARARVGRPGLLLTLGAALAPMAMHAFAWDTARITCYCLGGALIAAWILSETHPPQETEDRAWVLLAVQALAVNVLTDIPLMDREQDVFPVAVRALLYAPAIALATAAAVRHPAPQPAAVPRVGAVEPEWSEGAG